MGGILDSPCPSVRLYTCFPERYSSLLWNFIFKFYTHVLRGYGQKPIHFQGCNLQNVRLAAILGFSVSGLLTSVWLWISSPNSTCTSLVIMVKCLLILSNVTFKMDAWRPYWIFRFRFPDSLILIWLWIWNPNFSCKICVYMERGLLIFSNVTFKMAAWWPYWNFQFPDS